MHGVIINMSIIGLPVSVVMLTCAVVISPFLVVVGERQTGETQYESVIFHYFKPSVSFKLFCNILFVFCFCYT